MTLNDFIELLNQQVDKGHGEVQVGMTSSFFEGLSSPEIKYHPESEQFLEAFILNAGDNRIHIEKDVTLPIEIDLDTFSYRQKAKLRDLVYRSMVLDYRRKNENEPN